MVDQVKLKSLVKSSSLYDSAIIDAFEVANPSLSKDIKRAFSGKTLIPKRGKKRGIKFGINMKKNTFLSLYTDFQDNLLTLDEEERDEFFERANSVLEDYDVGDCLREEEMDSI